MLLGSLLLLPLQAYALNVGASAQPLAAEQHSLQHYDLLNITVMAFLSGALALLWLINISHVAARKDTRFFYLASYAGCFLVATLLCWNEESKALWAFNTSGLRHGAIVATLFFQVLLLHTFDHTKGHNPLWNKVIGFFLALVVCSMALGLNLPTAAADQLVSVSYLLCSLLSAAQLIMLFRQDTPQFAYLFTAKLVSTTLVVISWTVNLSSAQAIPIFHAVLLLGLLIETLLISYALIMLHIQNTYQRLRAHHQSVTSLELKKQYSDTLRRIDGELRTPISGVIGVAELLLDTALNKHQKDHILTIRRAGDKLMKWLNRLNDWRALQLGRLSFDSIPFDFSQLIHKLSGDLKAKALDRKIEFQFNPDCELPTLVKGDPARIKQILSGMLEMALHYSEQGSITLNIQPTGFENRWKLTVTDTQSGLQKEDLNFSQSSVEPSDLFDLNEEDLSVYGHRYESQQRNWLIAQSLAHKLGGHLSVDIEEDQVSYHCELNLVRHTLLQHNENAYNELLRNKRVLVVDDSTSSRKIIAKRADTWGMKVTALPNASDALALLYSIDKLGSAFDVIIFDHETPGINGLKFAEVINNDDQLNPKPVLVMLNGVHNESESGRQHGIHRLLSKPIDARTLKITLAEELTLAKSRQPKSVTLDEAHKDSDFDLQVAQPM